MHTSNPDANIHSGEETLAVSLMRLWERAHGTSVGNVHVFIHTDSVAAWIDAVLSPAEQAVAQSKDGRDLMQRYIDELLSSIQPELRAQVEAIVGRQITSGSVSIDLESSRMFCFFLLGQPLTRCPYVRTNEDLADCVRTKPLDSTQGV